MLPPDESHERDRNEREHARREEWQERESLRMLRQLVDSGATFRETHIRQGIAVEKMERYMEAHQRAMERLVDVVREDGEEFRREVRELRNAVASASEIASNAKIESAEWRKLVRQIIIALLVLMAGILASVGLYRASELAGV